ncbi:MAG TPA: glutamate-5-semialdehyde dehydrogenase [Phycisphaerae bacterium]|nr:glutamate-5-semialdehyde dehydrogenase [Phycisphaerae bacterium]
MAKAANKSGTLTATTRSKTVAAVPVQAEPATLTPAEITDKVLAMARKARQASRQLVTLTGNQRNSALLNIAQQLVDNKAKLIKENAADVAQAQSDGLAPAMISRLTLDEKKIDAMARSINEIAAQVDPVGQTIEAYQRPNGLRVEKRRVPIGVIGIIYESRPNVTSDAAALCLKSANAVILRGGRESIRSNAAIAQIITDALNKSGIDPNAVQLVDTTDRAAVGALVTAEGLVDLVIPRGGEELIRAVVEQATVPVIKHYKGVCHIYIDKFADPDMAVKVAYSAKVDGCAVCNTVECILVHNEMAPKVLPRLATRYREAGVQMRADARSLGLLQNAKLATEADWGREFLDLIIAIKQVQSIDAAIAHIAKYGSQHTDAIITSDIAAAEQFIAQVDSASVMVNASTRWADGYEYGLGAEIGISTDKLHARGPMGAADLCTYKFIVTGDGHIRT